VGVDGWFLISFSNAALFTGMSCWFVINGGFKFLFFFFGQKLGWEGEGYLKGDF
jgi:hypothetical protein